MWIQFLGLGEDYLALLIDSKRNMTSIVRNRFPTTDMLHSKIHDRQLLSPKNWTSFDILHNEKKLIVYKNNESILEWGSKRPLVFYSFSLACGGGWVAWTVNCEPYDVFGKPVHGGWSAWSSWECSATCGTGYGVSSFVSSHHICCHHWQRKYIDEHFFHAQEFVYRMLKNLVTFKKKISFV